jgi:hypothetical protein
MAKRTAKSVASKKDTATTETSKPPVASKPRKLKKPAYKSFQLQKPIKSAVVLPSGFQLLKRALGVINRNRKLFAGLVAVYGVLTVLLVQGFSAGGSLSSTKSTLDAALTGSLGQLASGSLLFVSLLGSSGNTLSPTAGAYQVMLSLIVSLAIIWVLRQLYADNKVRVRDGFYSGIYPLVPFVLVLMVIGLQLIPMFIGLSLYGTVNGNGIAVTAVEQALWIMIVFLLSLVSLYMLCSSLFALYIVSLPGMTPLRALRSARQLVAGRRWTVLRKVAFLPVALLILSGVLVIPIIIFATPLATWAFFIVSMCALPLLHSYMYALYRSLI